MRTKKRNIIFMGMLIGIIIVSGVRLYIRELKVYSGVPDLISSFSFGEDYSLTVIANSREISDKEQFSRKIIKMCQENSFKSIIFSTDYNGYPESLSINVYLIKEDIGEREPEMKIDFVPEDRNAGYNIRDNAEKYRLYVDGVRIDL